MQMANSKGLISEAKSINLSLHFLEQVVVCLRDRAAAEMKPSADNARVTASQHQPQQHQQQHHTHIPYRNSILTSLLRDSLGGNCKSCFLLTLSCERKQFDETVSTCRFGQRCGEVRLSVHANTDVQSNDALLELQIRIKLLEKHLAKVEKEKEELSKRVNRSATREISEEEHDVVRDTIQEFLLSTQRLVREHLDDQEHGGGVEDDDDRELDALDVFHDKIKDFDPAVTLEVGMALAGLVQNLYKDRERSKRHEQAARLAAAATQQATTAADHDDDDDHVGIMTLSLDEPQADLHLTAVSSSPSARDSGQYRGPASPGGRSARKSQSPSASPAPQSDIPLDVALNGSSLSDMRILTGQSQRSSPSREVTFSVPLVTPPPPPPSAAAAAMQELSRDTISMLTTGAVFMKHQHLGGRQSRHVSLSPDLLTLKWRALGQPSKQSTVGLDTFEGLVQLIIIIVIIKLVFTVNIVHAVYCHIFF